MTMPAVRHDDAAAAADVPRHACQRPLVWGLVVLVLLGAAGGVYYLQGARIAVRWPRSTRRVARWS